MTVCKKITKKPTKATSLEEKINRVINRGGDITKTEELIAKEIKFTLRLKADLTQKIDEKRKSRPGSISRHQWIVETLTKAVEK
jgi:hypothetical protein